MLLKQSLHVFRREQKLRIRAETAHQFILKKLEYDSSTVIKQKKTELAIF